MSVTECAYCGKFMEYDLKWFIEGRTGEPACDDCWHKEGEGGEDD